MTHTTAHAPTAGSPPALGGRELAAVLLLAVGARLAAVLVFDLRGLVTPASEPFAIARSLAAGQGFAFNWYGLHAQPEPTSFLPPLYPWILSVLLELAGGRPMLAMYLAQALNVVLGAATCLLVAHLAARSVDASAASPASGHWWDALRRPPLAAGLAWALYPPALGHTARAHTPVLEGFLLLLLAVLMLEAAWSDRRGALRWSAGAGVVLGLLLLVRPSYGLVWAAWGAILLWRIRGGSAAWRVVLVSGLLAALVLAPWTARNYRLHGALVPVATNGGFNFYIGNNPQVEGDIPGLDDFFATFPPEGADHWRAMTEVERDRELYRQGLAYWREHPGDAIRGALNRLTAYAFFRPYLFVAYPRWLAGLFVASYLAILVPFLLALPRSRGPVTLFSVAAIVVTGLVGLAYVVSMRFRASVEPFFVVVAARLVRR